MVKLNLEATTVAKIYRHYEKSAEDWRRGHLGASVIGRACSREIWYGFRWAMAPAFPGRMLRLFQRGETEEAQIIADLRAIGCEVTNQGDDGSQVRVSLAPHFGGSVDGIVKGLIEAPKTAHVLEVKTANTKTFRAMVKHGLRKTKPEHYAQTNVYLHGLGLRRAFYVMVCKETDEIYTERFNYDATEAKAMLSKAGAVIDSASPPTKINEDPTAFPCKFCEKAAICHRGEVDKLERNCRTCASATPEGDGTWSCAHHGKTLTGEEQRSGCNAHVFIPTLLPWPAVDADEDARWVDYDTPGGRLRDMGGRLEAQAVPAERG